MIIYTSNSDIMIVLVEHNDFVNHWICHPDLNVMEWSHPCPLCWVRCQVSYIGCHLAHPNKLTWCLTQQNGQGLDHSIVHGASARWRSNRIQQTDIVTHLMAMADANFKCANSQLLCLRVSRIIIILSSCDVHIPTQWLQIVMYFLPLSPTVVSRVKFFAQPLFHMTWSCPSKRRWVKTVKLVREDSGP